MKPARFDYVRPSSKDEVVEYLRRDDQVVKIVAGSQSLGPMLNLRLVQPDMLVDITGIPELKRAEATRDGLTLGACVTHADIEDGRVPDVSGGALARVARGIAYRAVRNRGTIGGSIAHADPSADWINSLAAMGASVLIHGPAGARRVPIEDFMVGVFETDLKDGEFLEAVHIPRLSPKARWGYHKLCRKTGEFAHAIGVVLDDPERNVCRMVIGATEARPVVVPDARRYLGGPEGVDVGGIRQLLSDAGHDDALDNQIHIAALKRAVQRAQSDDLSHAHRQ